MRLFFLFLPVAFATSSAQVAAEPARPIVVLVHGRGHVSDDTASLRRAWTRDLNVGLDAARAPALAESDVRLAWYADALDPDAESPCAPRRPRHADGGAADIATFAADFLGALAAAIPRDVTDGRAARGLLGEMLYAVDDRRRCAAEQRVGQVIRTALAEQRPVVIVAYSLGSLVTYGFLHALDDSAGVRLITIGSPLGIAEYRALLGHSVEMPRLPRSVKTWENVYDPADPFAAPLASPQLGTDHETRGPADDPHHVTRYLRDPATGEAVARALCAWGTPASCPRI